MADDGMISETVAAQVAEFFSAFSDKSRVRILSALQNCEMSVGDIASAVDLSESAVSHQLRGLRQMRLVKARKEGRQVFYCLDDDHIAAIFQTGLDHVRHS